MYNLAKLSDASNQFIQSLSSVAAGNSELVAMAVARAVSAILPLPSAELKVPGDYYTSDVLIKAREHVSTISDLISFDTTRAFELTKTFWSVRYKAAFPSNEIYSTFNQGTESEFLGFGSVLAESDVLFIKANTQKLISFYNSIALIFKEIYCLEVSSQEGQ